VLDDKHRQVVRYLSNVDEPIALVVILDASASMASKFQKHEKPSLNSLTHQTQVMISD
jgi:hypothetical protein